MIKETAVTKRKRTIAKTKSAISQQLIEAVCQRLANNERVRRTIPGKGRLHIDRQVPFLCVYRQPLGLRGCWHRTTRQGRSQLLDRAG